MNEYGLSPEVGLCVSLSQRHTAHDIQAYCCYSGFFRLFFFLLLQATLTKENVKFNGKLLLTHREG